MNQSNDESSIEEIQHLPLRGFYFILIAILAVISLVNLSVQTDDVRSNLWKLTAEIKVGSITLILLFLAWLLFLIPWIVLLWPKLLGLIAELRKRGVEKIKIGDFELGLTPDIKKAAEKKDAYQNKVKEDINRSEPSRELNSDFEKSYHQIADALLSSERLDSAKAMSLINQLSSSYDRVRQTMASSGERTRLMSRIASIMWALMPSAEEVFRSEVRERLISPSGGERLSAYKFLEWQPDIAYIDTLLSRAVGVLEEPFGQYGALLALRRVVLNQKPPMSESQHQSVLRTLKWAASIEYMSRDRRTLMETIKLSLE